MDAFHGPIGTSESVHAGIWCDYETKSWLFAVEDSSAAVLMTLLAVWLALAAPYVFKLLKYPFLCLFIWIFGGGDYQVVPGEPPAPPAIGAQQPADDGLRARDDLVDDPQAADGDLDDNPPGNGQPPPADAGDPEDPPDTQKNLAQVLDRSTSGRDLLANTARLMRSPRQPSVNKDVFGGMVILLIFLGVFAARAFGGYYATKTGYKGSFLWHSDQCGVWRFDSSRSGDAAATRADVYNRGKEIRAAEYAKYCYDAIESNRDDVSRTMLPLCHFFQEQQISYNRTFSWDSPFPSDKLLVEGVQPVTFDTGLVDATTIGVNYKEAWKFRRRTTCTPLRADHRFVDRTVVRGTETYKYYYGVINDTLGYTNYTFTSEGDPFDWLAPTYDVSAYSTTLFRDSDDWQPIPDISPPENSTVTIFFINPLHIMYLDPNDDPVFVADLPIRLPGSNSPVWVKDDAKYRPLACVDTTWLCPPDSDGTDCWSMADDRMDLADDGKKNPVSGYWLMKLSLAHSDVYNSIQRRLGTGLVGQEMLSLYISVALGSQHWALEAERLFQTSLARIQFDAWNIASGQDHVHEAEDGWINETPEEAGDLCGIFKYQGSGYTNIMLAIYIPLFLLTPALWLFSLEGAAQPHHHEAVLGHSDPMKTPLLYSTLRVLLFILRLVLSRPSSWLWRNVLAGGADWAKEKWVGAIDEMHAILVGEIDQDQ